jgi:ribosomal protein S30
LSNRGISTPRLYQDIILSNKSKGDPRVKYRKNYNLMHDGVHPQSIQKYSNKASLLDLKSQFILKLSNRGISTPRLYQYIILSNKSKGDPRVKYRKNYNLMHDGVHPIRTLAKLWAAKLVETTLNCS